VSKLQIRETRPACQILLPIRKVNKQAHRERQRGEDGTGALRKIQVGFMGGLMSRGKPER
jgi:hypothetical protein